MKNGRITILRDKAFRNVSTHLQPGRVLAYEMKGGQAGDHPWRTAGFFCEVVGQGRIVFEALQSRGIPAILIRVFRERTAKILWSGWIGKRDVVVQPSCVECFLTSVKGKRLANVVAKETKTSDLPPEFKEISLLLYPIPPPVTPDMFSK